MVQRREYAEAGQPVRQEDMPGQELTLELAGELWKPPSPVRALTVTAIHLTPEEETYEQADLFTAGSVLERKRQERLEAAMDGIRRRYGSSSIAFGTAKPEEGGGSFQK